MLNSPFLEKYKREVSKQKTIEVGEGFLNTQIEQVLQQLKHISISDRVTAIDIYRKKDGIYKLDVYTKKEVTREPK